MSHFVEIVLPLPLDQTFTYSLSEATKGVTIGQRVLVPFNKRKMAGYVVGFPAKAGEFEIKEVEAVLDDFPILTKDLLSLSRTMSKTYGAPIGKVISTILPPGLSKGTKKRESKKPNGKSRTRGSFDHAPDVLLTPEQNHAVQTISPYLSRNAFQTFLLYGVTGSGKTEVYLRLAAETLKLKKSVLALVPEIALTPQFVGRFRARLGENIAVLHSGRSAGERLNDWNRIRRGDVSIIIGARSAVFAPLQNLGLLIVDEEHDPSYKQEEGLKYNGRELARLRAKSAGAVFLLGSATPSLESFTAYESTMLSLPNRATGQTMPEAKLVDLRGKLSKSTDRGIFSEELREAIAETLERKEQVVLFLNRRGYAPTLLCPTCGFGVRCKNCSVAMTYHERPHHLLCHYCGLSIPGESPCSNCGQIKLIPIGVGTERIERELSFYFPDARVLRMDRDTVRFKGRHESILSSLAEGETDILIGTQMVTKGIDLPNVTLVGVLLADQALHFPDFRSAERTFQLLTQVVGRSGRSEKKGRAIIQTFQPTHYAIVAGAKQDYAAFYAQEILFRKELGYPPFTSLCLVEISGKDLGTVRNSARWLADQLKKRGSDRGVDWLGPAPAAVAKVNGQNRFQLILRSIDSEQVSQLARWLVRQAEAPLAERGVALSLDIDPYRFL